MTTRKKNLTEILYQKEEIHKIIVSLIEFLNDDNLTKTVIKDRVFKDFQNILFHFSCIGTIKSINPKKAIKFEDEVRDEVYGAFTRLRSVENIRIELMAIFSFLDTTIIQLSEKRKIDFHFHLPKPF